MKMSDLRGAAMTAMTAEEAHARVALGGAWLDELCPEWASEIDLDRLELDNPSQCILGQTAPCLTGGGEYRGYRSGGYYDVMAKYFGSDSWQWRWSEEHGFSLMTSICADSIMEFEMLEIAWRELILARRQVASVPAVAVPA